MLILFSRSCCWSKRFVLVYILLLVGMRLGTIFVPLVMSHSDTVIAVSNDTLYCSGTFITFGSFQCFKFLWASSSIFYLLNSDFYIFSSFFLKLLQVHQLFSWRRYPCYQSHSRWYESLISIVQFFFLMGIMNYAIIVHHVSPCLEVVLLFYSIFLLWHKLGQLQIWRY